MNDAARPRLVAFDRTSAEDVIEKLRRDVERIESTTERTLARDHIVNAFWTAWHIHRWLWDAISEQPELKATVLAYRGIDNEQVEDHKAFGAALARRFVPLNICRMIATSPRYVHVVLPCEGQSNLGLLVSAADGAGVGSSGGSADDPAAAVSNVGLVPMVVVMGRPIAATRLLDEVDEYWVTMILECGIE